MKLQKRLPLARDESKVERQEHPIAAQGEWVDVAEVTKDNQDHCDLLCKFGNFRIVD